MDNWKKGCVFAVVFFAVMFLVSQIAGIDTGGKIGAVVVGGLLGIDGYKNYYKKKEEKKDK